MGMLQKGEIPKDTESSAATDWNRERFSSCRVQSSSSLLARPPESPLLHIAWNSTSAVDFSRELSVGLVARCSFSSERNVKKKKKSDGIFKVNIFTLRRHAGCS